MARALRRPNLRFKVPNVRVPRLPRGDEPDVFDEMSLQEHLEELRSRIVKACLSVGVAFIGGVILTKPLLDLIVDQANATVANDGPGGLDIKGPTDPITITFKVALYIAIGFALPMILYQFIAFLSPGLTGKEKRILFSSLPFVSILFLGGVAYAFFFAVPRAFDFLSNWLPDIFSWQPDGQEVINFYLTLMIGLGISFQLPVIMFLLAKLNIVSPRKMAKNRKYAFLVILVVSAVITPSTDPINLAIVAVPLYLLFEAGIIVSRLFARPASGGEAPAAA